ncbi:hypothetical protein E4U55_005627 [Claviceps digitariae]|nr:hypothetical protein E4U55_005627 [Claviceps digitariae]
MASFARSFKPPAALLSPRCRPGMTGRTLSNSSDLSLAPNTVSAHQTDYFVDHPVASPLNSSSLSPTVGSLLEERPQSIAGSPEVSSTTPRANSSKPIPIEIPKPRRNFSSGPIGTPPPEPLSARGDRPGAYFPLHEDPRERVRRPHPFACEPAHLHQNWASDPITMQAERARSSHASMSASVTRSSTPVSCYIAPGFHDAPLPLGKYYPTNYEHQHAQQSNFPRSTLVSPSSTSSSVKSDHAPHARAESRRSENPHIDMRRRMQQYQRDMIAQAAMVLDSTTRAASPGVSLNGLPIKDIWLSGSMSNKPLSPRLHPLGSPGPVTPMELESSGGIYHDSGTRSPTKSGLAPPSGARPNFA